MKEKNLFRFSLYQGDVLFFERTFDADQINPFTRYTVNIKPIIPVLISEMQYMLSRKKYDTTHVVDDKVVYKFYDYHLSQLEKKYTEEYVPEEITQTASDGTPKKGILCKFMLSINDNRIVEREFLVSNFNPIARWSMDMAATLSFLTSRIENFIIKKDISNTWDDYDIINKYNLTINQVRDLLPAERNRLLYKLRS